MKTCCVFNVSEADKIKLNKTANNIEYNDDNDAIKEKLDELIHDEIIDANEIADGLFPIIKRNIFISHSRNDLELAKRLAEYLEEKYNLTTFIDSILWDNIYDYQDKLNEKFKQGENYSYNIINKIAKNMDIILTTSLQREIDGCDILLFLNKDTNLYDDNQEFSCVIDSPWIYSELTFANLLLKNQNAELNEELYHGDSLEFKYSFSSTNFPEISLDDIDKIEYKKDTFGLDSVDAFTDVIHDKLKERKQKLILKEDFYE